MSDDPPRDQPIGSGVGRDPVEDALTAAAAAPVALGDERLAALEARIMGSVADGDVRGLVAAVGSAPVGRVRRRNRAASLLAAAAVVLVIASAHSPSFWSPLMTTSWPSWPPIASSSSFPTARPSPERRGPSCRTAPASR